MASRKPRTITWEEAIEKAVKYTKPILDKLREYDLKKSKTN